MKNFYFRDFTINNEKFTFVPSHKTPLKLHQNDVDLCNTNLTIPYEEMETAINELQTFGRYKDFVIAEYIEERNKQLEEYNKRCNKIFEDARKERKRKERIIKEIINEVKEYCNKRQVTLVYNKLEENIKQGYFMIWEYIGEQKLIYLKEIGIKEYN